MRLPALLLFAALTNLALAQDPSDVCVDALVCDPDGRPFAGAQFGDFWQQHDGRWCPGFCMRSSTALTSDRNGCIHGTWTVMGNETLLGLSADRRFAAFVRWESDELTHQLRVPERIVMQPATHLRGRLRTASGAVPEAWGGISWQEPAQTSTGLRMALTDASFDLPLPPRRYELRLHCTFGQASQRTIVLDANRRELDLGPITMQLQAFALPGEVLPDWHVDRAANIELANANLADFRGKPTLVCFDEFPDRGRMNQAARESLARLAQHPHHDAFHVVLFDTSDPRPWPFTTKPTEPVIETMFPLLADSSHQTEALYGSRWAVIVLDAGGRLMRCATSVDEAVATLERMLGT